MGTIIYSGSSKEPENIYNMSCLLSSMSFASLSFRRSFRRRR